MADEAGTPKEKDPTPWDAAVDLQFIGGYSNLALVPKNDDPGVAGTIIRRIILKDKRGVLLDVSLTLQDLIFLVFGLSRNILKDVDMVERLGNFSFHDGSVTHQNSLKYLKEGSEKLLEAKEKYEKVGSWLNPMPTEPKTP